MERALALLVEEGAGREATAAQGNIAIASYAIHGPAESLAAFERAIIFSEGRGLLEVAAHLESNCPMQLQELGRSKEALERIAKCARTLETRGLTHPLIEPRAVELALRLAGAEQGLRGEAEWLVETGRKAGSVDSLSTAFASAAAALAGESPQEAAALLCELEQTPGTTGTVYYARQLAAMVRTALGIGDVRLAEQLVGRLEPHYPVDEHALCAARAQLAEASGDHTYAANLYAEASERWQQFGNLSERAYALLGHGRCLRGLGSAEAETPLAEARELFRAMGYETALVETNALLDAEASSAQR
jgi:tetratricopeptide (TPR) repeat protein